MNRKTETKTLDMTQGDPLKLVLRYAVPLLIGTVFQQLYNLVDTMIAGQFLGSDAVAAIGATSSLYQMILGIAFGLNSGYAIILSQLFGAGDRERFKKGVSAMLILNLGLTILISGVSLILIHPIMKALGTPDDIYERATLYITIILGGMIMSSLYNMAAGFLRSVGNSRAPLYFLIISSILNLVLDILFVAVCGFGVAGTAAATVAAQAVSAFLAIIYILKGYQILLPGKEQLKPDGRIAADMFFTGLSVAVMECVYATGSVILQRAINGLGTSVITAHTAARKVIDLLKAPLSTLGNATSVFAGQNYGARKPERIRTGVRNCILTAVVWCAVSGLIVVTLGRPLMVLLSGSHEAGIISNALLYLRISTAFLFPLAILFCIRYVMQAAGHKIIPVFSSMIELVMKVVSALFLVSRFGYPGAASTEPATWLVCGLFLLVLWLVYGRKMKEISEN